MLFVKMEASTYRCLVRSLLHIHTETDIHRRTLHPSIFFFYFFMFYAVRFDSCFLFSLSTITEVVVITSTSFDILLFFFSFPLSAHFESLFPLRVFPLDVIAYLSLSHLINTHRARR